MLANENSTITLVRTEKSRPKWRESTLSWRDVFVGQGMQKYFIYFENIRRD